MAETSQRPVAVVVGVGAGLGAALARRFASGYRVAMLARGEEYLTSLAKEIESAGGHALAVPADVSQEKQIEGAFTAIRSELGAPEVLLYNAAMRPFGRLMETKPSTFENTWRVCVLGAFLCARHVRHDMPCTKVSSCSQGRLLVSSRSRHRRRLARRSSLCVGWRRY